MTSLQPSVAPVDLGAVANAAIARRPNALDAARASHPNALAETITGAGIGSNVARNNRLYKQAQDFETQFLNSMFQQMYAGLHGDGPFGDSVGVGPWRSFVTEEYAKNMVQQGGIGVTDSVYRSLLALQEARAR
jgi:Rod binding domain-containing protein